MTALICANCRNNVPAGSSFCPGCGRPLPPNASKKRGHLRPLLLLGLLAFIVAIIVNTSSDRSRNQSPISPPADTPPPADPHDTAMSNTSITKFSWYKDAFDTIMKANFTIKNNGDVAVKDIEIKCVHSAPSGTVIDENTRTIYEIIPAHKTRTFRGFDMGFIHSQAASSSCHIEDLTLAP